MSSDVLLCASCSHPLTRPVTRVDRLPDRVHDGPELVGFEPTLVAGTWALDPSPRIRHENGDPADHPGWLVLNPEDGLDLEVHPDRSRNSGCCGHDGLDGPNRRCPSRHTDAATLSDDCWTSVELRFEPSAVRIVSKAR